MTKPIVIILKRRRLGPRAKDTSCKFYKMLGETQLATIYTVPSAHDWQNSINEGCVGGGGHNDNDIEYNMVNLVKFCYVWLAWRKLSFIRVVLCTATTSKFTTPSPA
jgi:hypothetical protein